MAPSCIAGELAEYIKSNRMSLNRWAPRHSHTQGYIERWHQTLKNRILLENYFLPGNFVAKIQAFIEHYNHLRFHQSLKHVTLADVYFGRAPAIIKKREWKKAHHPTSTLATSQTSRLNSNHRMGPYLV
jgi:putative transposase